MSTETLQFRTELKQLLHLIVHSLYSHKDIFLRELISNASDAIDTLRFQSLTKPELVEGDPDWKIKLVPDETQSTLTVSDNGVGMTHDSIVENLGTIARSGTRQFLEALQQADARDRPALIGQFGVGFYSSFMVADRVTVVSRAAGVARNEAVRWESDGQGEFRVESVEKETRGTDVILHLRDDSKEFLDPWRLRQLVKKYSDFVEHPILMDVEREEGKEKVKAEETLNSRKALWLRNRSEIKPEEYAEFYKQLAHDNEEPAKIIHYRAEGKIEFRALMFLPKHRTFDLLGWSDRRKGLHLYIQRIFIMDDCEALLPSYLRFVKGVVDSPDLPLNVSREILQQSAPLEKIKSNLVAKVLSTLDEWKRKEREGYVAFFKDLGPILKEGVSQDWENRQQLAQVLLFESTKTEPGQLTTLDEYVERMPVSQEAIYYLIGETREQIAHSPYLESFRAAGQEVLPLTDPVDEFVVGALHEYKGKELRAVDRGELKTAEVSEEKTQAFAPLLDFMKARLSEVKDVRLTGRLKESASCLVADEGELGAHMERLMQRLGRGHELPAAKKILEVNPEHPALEAMRKLVGKEGNESRLEGYCRLLHEQALLAEGSRLPSPQAFAQRINEILARDAST
ncbi:MAG: molecular chaperone HtpG [Gemmataceae bacterium]|nr:molecular chaperone HtpG [Gemmataceae bacterium]